ncbi:hypothetical protein GEMRC1_006307 [Eukaryota sp. GEM-RC1]
MDDSILLLFPAEHFRYCLKVIIEKVNLYLIISDSPNDFHNANRRLNHLHYSRSQGWPGIKAMLKYPRSSYHIFPISKFNYNVNQLEGPTQFSYIIMSTKDFLSDLEKWSRSFAISIVVSPSLRMLKVDDDLQSQVESIRRSYLSLCILSLPPQFSLKQLASQLATLMLESLSSEPTSLCNEICKSYTEDIHNLIGLRLITVCRPHHFTRVLRSDCFFDLVAFLPARLQTAVERRFTENLSCDFLYQELRSDFEIFKECLLCNL